jgi:hypothetical protein
VSNRQNVLCSVMGGTSEMKSPLHMQDRRASLCDEDSPSVGELHTDNPSIITSEQAKSKLFFDLSNLSAERRLGEVQSEGGLRKVQLFAQGNGCVQVAYFDVGEHGSKLRSRVG